MVEWLSCKQLTRVRFSHTAPGQKAMLDYYSAHIYYDETSPTFLRNKYTRNSRALKDAPQGCLNGGGGGYTTIALDGVRLQVHRVIWEMFNGPIPKGLVIDHIDSNRQNNKISNLQCITMAANSQKGLSAKLTPELVQEIRNSYIPYSREFGTRQLQKKYGINHTTVSRVVRDIFWK